MTIWRSFRNAAPVATTSAALRIAGFERRVAIAFTFDAETVTIVRVFYGGRDYEALLCETDRAGPARPER